MISFLVCSIDKERLATFEANIANTIGVPFELISFDNTLKNWGLSKVYNHCAKEAKYDNLCFSHEDILFFTNNWGNIILEKLELPDTGVIGFAGSITKSKSYSGWGSANKDYNRYNYIEVNKAGVETNYLNNPKDEKFSRVVVLDGNCLFVKKSVWNCAQFDEELFSGFHLYDLDFTFNVAQCFSNYVCQCITIKHYSEGSYNVKWKEFSLLFHDKWESKLPYSIEELPIKRLVTNEVKAMREFLRFSKKSRDSFSNSEIRFFLISIYKRYPFNKHVIKLLLRYFILRKI